MTDWQELLCTRSESDVLSAIHAAIDRGEVLDGLAGLEEMIHLMPRKRRPVNRHTIRDVR